MMSVHYRKKANFSEEGWSVQQGIPYRSKRRGGSGILSTEVLEY